ncbi:hypothetical protein SBOR_6852 [Sclerotinia borealis F-4128]|uniref:Uncharacterized protein n=1 Tax=Sclerotinia borealis (strain F-4128) TaxID=1432307 RepID=W9CDW2_SCLBF|nr:hypothetical protein SBOR_6852 [Sclerotinia borealis F-4128]
MEELDSICFGKSQDLLETDGRSPDLALLATQDLSFWIIQVAVLDNIAQIQKTGGAQKAPLNLLYEISFYDTYTDEDLEQMNLTQNDPVLRETNLNSLLPFLRLKSLTHFKAQGICIAPQAETILHKAYLPTLSLRLHATTISDPALVSFLSRFKSLECLIFSEQDIPEPSDNQIICPLDIVKGISHLKHSLKHLEVAVDTPDGYEGVIDTFNNFESLERLEIGAFSMMAKKLGEDTGFESQVPYKFPSTRVH